MGTSAQEEIDWLNLYQSDTNFVWIRVDKDNSIQLTPEGQTVLSFSDSNRSSISQLPAKLVGVVDRVRASRSPECLTWEEGKTTFRASAKYIATDDCVFISVEAIAHRSTPDWSKFDTLPVGVLVCDSSLKIIHINPSLKSLLLNLFGEKNWIGQKPSEMLYSKDWDLVKYHLSRNTKLGKDISDEIYNFRLSNEEEHWYKGIISKEKGQYEDETYYVGLIFSIEEEKTVEARLRRSEDRLRSIFYNAQGGLVLTNSDKRIIAANTAYCKMIGFDSESEVRGVLATEFVFPEDREREKELYQDLIENRKSHYRIEKRYVNQQGETTWADVIVSAIWGKSSVPTNFISIIQDIQAAKENEERLIALGNLKDKFFSIISHDLKNPLSAIISLTDLAEESGKRGQMDDVMEMLDLIKVSSYRIHDLLLNVLDWSRSQQGTLSYTPVSVEVHEFLNNTLALLQNSFQQKDITLKREVEEGLKVEADVHMLQSILLNLLTNALKYTVRGGEILLSVNKQDDIVTFKVNDTGVGMSEEQIQSVYNMTTTNRANGTEDEPGTGLGLILVQEFVAAHGSSLHIESELGEGTTFQFALRSL